MFAKKTLVAAAALLAVAGAAQAQSSVKLYGYIEASVGSFEDFALSKNDDGDIIGRSTDRATKVESGNMMTSYIGLSGSEDLGGGLKAEFVLESFLAGDTGSTLTNMAGGFWGRGSWVGLSGDFGRVALGQYDNAFFTMGLLYNPFGSSMTLRSVKRSSCPQSSSAAGAYRDPSYRSSDVAGKSNQRRCSKSSLRRSSATCRASPPACGSGSESNNARASAR